MPICYIDAPPGISPDAKKKMMEKITAAIDEGYNHIGDTFIFLHEDNLENVMLNGGCNRKIRNLPTLCENAVPNPRDLRSENVRGGCLRSL